MRIINIGRFPPPIGGVSYFLKRLKPYLDEKYNNSTFYDISMQEYKHKRELGVLCCSAPICFLRIMLTEKSLVVFHSNNIYILLAIQILAQKHKIAVFTHGESILKKNKSNFFIRYMLRKVDYFVAPTKLIYNKLVTEQNLKNSEILNIPFILFPKKIEDINNPKILKIKEQSDYLLSGYANDLTFMNGQDLYGVDMMIDVVHRLRNSDSINVSLVILLPKCSNERYMEELNKRIEQYSLNDNIIILHEKIDEAASLYKLSDVYIRPTNTDGDSFSVWEALYTKTPVVASDAAQRPNGCITFTNRNASDFYDVLKGVLNNLDYYNDKIKKLNIKGSENQLIDFFSSAIEDSIQ